MTPFIKVSNLSYSFPNGKKLFENINFNISTEKTGLIGDNGCGKTTLLKLISGELKQSSGSIKINGSIIKFEQDQSNLPGLDIVDVLGVKDTLMAFQKITAGLGGEHDFQTLGDYWGIEQKIDNVLLSFGLSYISRERKFSSLSGGEAERLMLAACMIKRRDFILFDEPTNHLDLQSRRDFYQIINNYDKGLVVVSHDRELLRQMDKIAELSDKGIKIYGGNYDFYCMQTQVEKDALVQKINTVEIELKKQIKISTAVVAAKENSNKQAKRNNKNSGIPKILLNARRGNAEKTLSKIKNVHEQKINEITDRLNILKGNSAQNRTIKIDLGTRSQVKKKFLVKAAELNYSYNSINIWITGLNFEIESHDRILISGSNGSGKTTLVNLIAKRILPTEGSINVNCSNIGILDQKYETLQPELTVLENIRRFANSNIPEHELRIRLARFLFYNDNAFKITGNISGGEKSRLTMACLLASSNLPELIILDEPTNNLDLKSIEQIQSSLSEYNGALIVISHDIDFVQEIGINKIINLDDFSTLRTLSKENHEKMISGKLPGFF